ncbi:hypothetical protein HMN09_00265800 [Mycena chlorophos]|uniref:Uncharacterized protein n=1 Tax=Mycena chlorophos TaxID=658473 RepID=A0A8H6TK87_MYCCL|nr:hypothetical protein HMN09_00265800 [Mycena chlorophos]
MRLSPAIVLALFTSVVLADIPVTYLPSGTPIFSLPQGSHLQQSGSNLNVVSADGTTIHVFENLRGGGSPKAAKRQSLSVPVDATAPLPDNSTILSFNATIVVPPAPTTFDSQIMFFTYGVAFPDPDDGGPLYMAAGLQYGGTIFQGGPYWTLTFLSESVQSNLFLQPYLGNSIVYPGDVLNMSISVAPYTAYDIPGLWAYTLGFNDDPNLSTTEIFEDPPPTTLVIRGQEEGVSQVSDYPTGSVVFQDITLVLNTTTGPSSPASISWTTDTNSTVEPNLEIELEGNGSSDSQITIVFPGSG